MNKRFRVVPAIVGILFLGVLTACGGGGGGAAPAATTPAVTAATVAINGTLSAAASKPSSGKSAQLYVVSSWAGATLQVIDSAGTVVGTGTVNADGTYSVSVPAGSNYFIKVQIGNLVLKAFVPSVTAAASVNVNTTTTAEVMVLAAVLGVANIGDSGVSAVTAIASVNMTTVITQIEANTNLATIAGSLATEIASNYDASATTPAIGSASATVATTVTTIAGTVGGSIVPAPPSAPTGIGVTGGNGQAAISWTAVAEATSYNVYYRTIAGVTIANGTKITGAASGAAITGLVNGTTYYFVVTAVNAGGESAVSSEVGATPQVPAPGVPSGIGVIAGVAQATVSWTAVTGATSYNVYRGTSAGVTTANGTKTTGATSGGAITGLSNGTTYYFVVTAVNAGGESAVSGEVSATPQVPAPGVPSGIGVIAGVAQATISWTAVTGATSYNVYRGTSAGVTTANGTKTTGATSGGAITGLSNGTTYYFVVTAVNAGGESAVSGEVSAMPQVAIPAAPTGVVVTSGNGQATVSWTAVTGATSYNVYRGTSASVTTANGTKTTGATSGGAVAGLANNTKYYFVVTAVNAGGESVVSSEASATTWKVSRFAYVANYWSATVSSYTVDGTTGALRPTGYVAAGYVTAVTVDPAGKFVYAVEPSQNKIYAYTINQTTGRLTAVSGIPYTFGVVGTTPSAVTVDPTGLFAYVANATDGTVSAYTINQGTGALTAVAGAGNGTTGTNGSGVIAAGTAPSSVTIDPAGKFAYAANKTSNDVSVYTINQGTGALTAVGAAVAAGTLPMSVTVDPAGKFAYAANQTSNDISMFTINPSTGALTSVGTAVAAGTGPISVAVDPAGKFAYAANYGSDNVSAYTINQTTGALTSVGAAVAAGTTPYWVTVDPSGQLAYAANYGGTVSIYTINQTSGALTLSRTNAAQMTPESIAIAGGSAAVTYVPKFAYAANRGDASVSAYTVDPATGALTAVIGSGNGTTGTNASGAIATGTQPVSVAVDPLGRFAYAANYASSNISYYTIDPATGALTGGSLVAAGTWPASVAVDPTGRYAYVANYASTNVSCYTIDQVTGALVSIGAAVGAGSGPQGVTVDPSGRFVYVANSGVDNNVSMYAIDLPTGVLFSIGGAVAAGSGPYSVTVDPTGRFAYVPNAGSNNVSAYTIDLATGALTPVVGAGNGTTGTNASGTIAAGTNPRSVTIDPAGKFAYATNWAGGGVWSGYTINQSTGELTAMTPATFTTGSNPNSVTVDPSGRFAYIANYTPATVTAYTIDSATGAPTAVVGAGNGTTGTNSSGTIAAGVQASSVVISGAIQ